MLWIVKNIICSPVFDYFARIHDRNPLTHTGNNAKVMGNHDNCHAKLVLQLHHQLQDLRLNRHIQSRRRLVRNQKLRLTGKRHSNHDTLPHTSRKLVRILFETLIRLIDSYQLQKLFRPFPCLRFVLIRMQKHRFHNLVANRINRV